MVGSLDGFVTVQHCSALDDARESRLIDIMSCCVRQVSGGEPPPGRHAHGTRGKGPTAGGRDGERRAREERASVTEHFMKHLPALLNKYVADKEKLVNLMDILMQMDVEKIGGRHDKALDALLKLLEAIVDRHADLPVFYGCSFS